MPGHRVVQDTVSYSSASTSYERIMCLGPKCGEAAIVWDHLDERGMSREWWEERKERFRTVEHPEETS